MVDKRRTPTKSNERNPEMQRTSPGINDALQMVNDSIISFKAAKKEAMMLQIEH